MQASDWVALVALLVSIAAASRPEFERWYARTRGRVKAYPGGLIELGFSSVGHTIAVEGNLRARHEDFFLYSASLRVRHESGEEIFFDLAGFRPRKLVATVQPAADMAILSPVGIELKKDAAHYYHFIFTDHSAAQSVNNILQELRSEVRSALQEANVIPFSDPASQARVQDVQSAFANDLYKTGRFQILADRIAGHCRWLAGRYTATLSLECADPRALFREEWSFEVSADDVFRLRQNSVILMFQNFGQLSLRLNFPEIAYLKVGDEEPSENKSGRA